jgi:thiol-disulfide isomerase/thioredoxin
MIRHEAPMRIRKTWRTLAIHMLAGGALVVLSGAAATPAAKPASPAAPPIVPVTGSQLRARAVAPGARATLVNVWATWCVPCREEFPALLAATRAHRAEGLRVLLVSADFHDQLPAVRKFLVKYGVTDTCYLKTGPDMAFIDTLAREWSGAMPATLVYDASGRRTAFWEGAADSARFATAIRTALDATTSSKEERP